MDTPDILSDAEIPPPLPGRTLLPAPIAQAVSIATRSTCLALRLSSTAGSYGLGAAKFTTLSSLELARSLVETVLSRAGRETLSRSRSDLATAEAETIIERSFESLHNTMSQAVFWTTAGFYLTSTTFSMASGASQLLLSSLDQLFGSTDSSRAIASIITLIRREFRDPATGVQGESVGVIDLVLGLSALAYLQQRCRKTSHEEQRRAECEEIVWDVVVLNDGERIDVQGPVSGPILEPELQDSPGFEPADMSSKVKSPSISWSDASQDHHPNIHDEDAAIVRRLKDEIVQSLPPDTSISISNSISSIQTITIDVDGPRPFTLPSMPGADIIEVRKPASRESARPGQPPLEQDASSSYRLVYKLERSKAGSTSFQGCQDESQLVIEQLDDDPSQTSTKYAPQVPKKTKSSGIRPPSSQCSRIAKNNADQPSRPSSREAVRSRSDSTFTEKQGTQKPRSPASSPPLPAESTKSHREANQKKPRASINTDTARSKVGAARKSSSVTKRPAPRNTANSSAGDRGAEKKSGLRQFLREGSQPLSNIWHKDVTSPGSKLQSRPRASTLVKPTHPRKPSIIIRTSSDQSEPAVPDPFPRSSSRTSHVSIQERRRGSIISHTDTSYSVYSTGGASLHSPSASQSEVSLVPSWLRSSQDGHHLGPPPSGRPGSLRKTPSLYSLASNDSQASVVLSYYYQKSAYTATDALAGLRHDGVIDGVFPRVHVLRNITRYMRFSSASYGSNFLKLMGISKEMPLSRTWDSTHVDVRHFVHHTESDMQSILLASFVDPQGGTDSSGSTGTGVPLVHYVSLDHDAKAVVLACRGTLGFEDVLADMTCDYDFLTWRGRAHKVHKGVHASARRLLYGGDRRVLVTIREALLEFPDYGLVLCGHSLGGAVTALLGVMLSEPNPADTGFVTAIEPPDRPVGDQKPDGLRPVHSTLPPRRQIHVYAYGPPGTMSASLRKRTRGLITTIVYGNDIVPYLSLGVLHDFQSVAVAFKNDQNQAKAEIRQRLWKAFHSGVADKWYGNMPSVPSEDTSKWGLSVLHGLRAGMTNRKLVPPGEVFTVESQRVLRRDAFVLLEEDNIGRPAQRIVLKYVKDVEARFKELRFGTSMLVDHNPAKYEEALNKLRLGVA